MPKKKKEKKAKKPTATVSKKKVEKEAKEPAVLVAKKKRAYSKGGGAQPETWQTAENADKLPVMDGRADEIQKFAVAVAALDKELVLHKGRHGFSLHHPKRRALLMGIGGSSTTLRLTSKLFRKESDAGCEVDGKGYPTIRIEQPEIEDAIAFGEKVLIRWELEQKK